MSPLPCAWLPTGRPAVGSLFLPSRSRGRPRYRCRRRRPRYRTCRHSVPWLLLSAALTAAPAWATGPSRGISLHPVSLELPGAPAAVIPADLDGDRRMDLVVVVNVSEWTQKEVQDSSQMSQVKGLLDAMTIIPAIDD
ncbi:MAG TPA: VCBS repeat-containing protein, partial [Thermoanaerobaculia bacterium]|nr:VCBS repeat-containing protein [Thermoanaerobaculia bacterium]